VNLIKVYNVWRYHKEATMSNSQMLLKRERIEIQPELGASGSYL
jgi:hypothetical protein